MLDVQYRDRGVAGREAPAAAEMLRRVGIADPERRLGRLPA